MKGDGERITPQRSQRKVCSFAGSDLLFFYPRGINGVLVAAAACCSFASSSVDKLFGQQAMAMAMAMAFATKSDYARTYFDTI